MPRGKGGAGPLGSAPQRQVLALSHGPGIGEWREGRTHPGKAGSRARCMHVSGESRGRAAKPCFRCQEGHATVCHTPPPHPIHFWPLKPRLCFLLISLEDCSHGPPAQKTLCWARSSFMDAKNLVGLDCFDCEVSPGAAEPCAGISIAHHLSLTCPKRNKAS